MKTDNTFYRISVKALVFDETRKKFLLLEEASGVHDLPGGGLNHGEALLDCLRREVTEETGLELTWISEQPLMMCTAQKRNGMWVANVLFEATIKNTDFTPSNECVALRFVTTQEASQLRVCSNIPGIIAWLEKVGGPPHCVPVGRSAV